MKRLLILCLIFLMPTGTAFGKSLKDYKVGGVYCNSNGKCGIVKKVYQDDEGVWALEYDLKEYREQQEASILRDKAERYDKLMNAIRE